MTDDKTPPPQVWPSLRAADARALIRFLVEVFGFEETVVYGDGPAVQHAQLSWPEGGGIMLGSARDDPDDPWNQGDRLTQGFDAAQREGQQAGRAVGVGCHGPLSHSRRVRQ